MSPVIPRSLIITGLTMPSDHGFIGGGGSGLVFKGELEGKAVALKVLHKTRNNVVRHPPANPLKSLLSISFQKQALCQEALMWRSSNDRYVLPFWGIYENEASSQSFFVSPYMANGTLAQWRKREAPSPLAVTSRVRFILSAVSHWILIFLPTTATGGRSGSQVHPF